METQDYLNRMDVFRYLEKKLQDAGLSDDELSRVHVGAAVGSRPQQWSIGCWPKKTLEESGNDNLSRIVRAYAVLKWAKSTPDADDECRSAAFEYADQTVEHDRSMRLMAGRPKGAISQVVKYLTELLEKHKDENTRNLWFLVRGESGGDDSPFDTADSVDIDNLYPKDSEFPYSYQNFQKRISEIRSVIKKNSAVR